MISVRNGSYSASLSFIFIGDCRFPAQLGNSDKCGHTSGPVSGGNNRN